MAKSMRSKWKRKMRAVKRVKVDEKVKVKLLEKIAKNMAEQELAEMKDTSVPQAEVQNPENVEMSEDVEMQDKPEKIYNSRTLLDKNGSYPKWLNQRAMKKLKKKQLKNMKKK